MLRKRVDAKFGNVIEVPVWWLLTLKSNVDSNVADKIDSIINYERSGSYGQATVRID